VLNTVVQPIPTGQLYFRDNEKAKAIEYAEKSLINNQYNIEALKLLAVIYR
jgi:hypothetical protein